MAPKLSVPYYDATSGEASSLSNYALVEEIEPNVSRDQASISLVENLLRGSPAPCLMYGEQQPPLTSTNGDEEVTRSRLIEIIQSALDVADLETLREDPFRSENDHNPYTELVCTRSESGSKNRCARVKRNYGKPSQ